MSLGAVGFRVFMPYISQGEAHSCCSGEQWGSFDGTTGQCDKDVTKFGPSVPVSLSPVLSFSHRNVTSIPAYDWSLHHHLRSL